MVRTRAPVASIDAAGKLAGALIFQQSKGRSYARKLTKPKQPRTPAQLGQRALTNFIAKQWSTISAPDQATWSDLAAQLELAPYHAYLKVNLQRWSRYAHPAQAYPPAHDDTPATGVSTLPANVSRGVAFLIGAPLYNDNWGLTIHRSVATGFTPTNANAVHTLPAKAAPIQPWYDKPLAPGTYYYRLVPFSLHGVTGTPSAQVSGTPIW